MILRLAVVACVAAATCAAEPRLEPLPIDVALNAPGLAPWQPVALSPDGQAVAWIVSDPQKKRQQEDAARLAGTAIEFTERWFLGCRLEVADTATGEITVVTDYDSNSHGPAWSPDGRHLAYATGTGPAQRLRLWDRVSRSSRLVSNRETSLWSGAPVWFPDSRHLLILVPRAKPAPTPSPTPAPMAARRADAPNVKVYRSAAVSPTVSTAPPGPWILNRGTMALARVDLTTGEFQTLIPEASETNVLKYVLSPDGRRVAYARSTGFASANSQQTLWEIHALSLADGRDEVLARDVPMLFGWGLSWSPDSGILAWVTGGVRAPCELGLYDFASKERRALTYAEKPDTPLSALNRLNPTEVTTNGVVAPLWHPNGQELYLKDPRQKSVFAVRLQDDSVSSVFTPTDEQVLGFVRTNGGKPGARLHVFTGHERTKQVSLNEVDLVSRASRRLWSEDSSINGPVGAMTASALAYIEERAHASPQVWLRTPLQGPPRRMSRVGSDFDRYSFGESRLIEWRTRGEDLQGVLILPPGHKSGDRHPLVVFPYGSGFKSNSLHQFAGGEGFVMATTDNMQLLATRGYAVLLPDVPGRRGSLMKDYCESILGAVDAAIGLGVVDPERLGIMGHSNGGYTVMAVIAQTTRFKAAISRAGFSDYVSLGFAMNADGTNYGLNIAEELQLAGPLWEARSNWIENSPIHLFDRVRTPTLIIHGSADTAVSPFAADQAFVALRRLNQPVEYAKYLDEGHSESLWSYANRVDYLERMLGWFDRYLMHPAPASQRPATAGR